MVKNKHKNLRWIFVACLALALFITNIIVSNTNDPDINITKLPEEFITNYLDEVGTLDQDHKDYTVIVTSAKSLPETYGAAKVIEAPNHQYILQYDSETAKNAAIRGLREDGIAAQPNFQYKVFQDYNSWGVSTMSIDYALENIPTTSQNSINAAVIDTGLDIDLFNTYYSGKLAGSFNAVHPDQDVTDLHGHGTHVSGTVAEATPSYVKLFAVQASATDDGNLYTSDIITGINYITYYHAADVINMSFGSVYTGDESDVALYQAIEAAKQENIISVAAAGNDSTDAPSAPASFDNTISISAVDASFKLASFSNYGDTITFAAPGVNIKSLMGNNVTLTSYKQPGDDDDHGTISGTSMAAPHATAAVAIIKSINPSLTFDNTVNALKDHAIDLGTSGWDSSFGYGLISFADTNFCANSNSQNCDDYGVFRKMVASQISVSPQLTDFNYYSLTNILPSTITITGTDGFSETHILGELDDVKITGYNPLATSEQTVYVEYLGLETSFKVTNYTDYTSGWVYETSTDDTIAITKYTDSHQKAYKLYIPSQITGKNVTAIKPGTFSSSTNAANYRTLILPSTITTLNNIGNTFVELSSIESQASELTLGSIAIHNLPKLQTITGNILLNASSSGALSNNPLLTTVTLSENTTIIPMDAFFGDKSLKTIVLPDGVTAIEENAFRGTGLTAIALGNNLTTIGAYAFNSSALESIYIPASVTSIDHTAFGWIDTLESLTIAADNPVYDSRDNANAIIVTATNILITGISTTQIPNTVTAIASNAFNQMSLIGIEIPANVQTIEANAFNDCFSLFYIKFPNNQINLADSIITNNTGIWTPVGITFWVYDHSDTLAYAIERDITYRIIDESSSDDKLIVHIAAKYIPGWEEGRNYRAFEQITPENLELTITYLDYTDEVITTFNSVDYEGGADSLRAKDKFAVGIDYGTETGYRHLYQTLELTVEKVDPTYTTPTGLTADPGQTLSELTLPTNFSWMDASTIIEGAGNVTYYAKYTPTDTDNYNIIEDIPVTIYVHTTKTLLTPNFSIAPVPYNDSTDHIDPADITVTNLATDEYTVVGSTITSNTTATIVLRLSDAKFADYYFDGGIQEKAFDVTITTTSISSDYSGLYDGAAHSFTFNINTDGCSIVYALDGENFNITTKPSFTEIGNYFVDMRISCPDRETITNFAIISIQGFTVTGNLAIIRTAIVTPDNSTSTLIDNIVLNQGLMGTMPEIHDHDGTDLGFPYPDTLKTGYQYHYGIGDTYYTHDIAVLGDNNGDGEINDLDFTALKEHLRTGSGLDGVYAIASDVKRTDDDVTLNSGDLLRYKQHILNISTIGGDH